MHEVKEIYKEILMRQSVALKFHSDMKNLFDFLNLRKWKRKHEYQMFKEGAEMSGLQRYFINHHGYLIHEGNVPDTHYIPNELYNVHRLEVTDAQRKQATRQAFRAYCDWERDTKDFLQKQFAKLGRLEKTADQNKINELIKDVDMELKEVEREYISVFSDDQWHTVIEPSYQEAGHDHYDKMTKEIGINIC